jgi:hypothetical protein
MGEGAGSPALFALVAAVEVDGDAFLPCMAAAFRLVDPGQSVAAAGDVALCHTANCRDEGAMLSAEEWWGVMALYGEQVWPSQVVLYLAALGAVLLVFARPGAVADMVMRAYLALAFGWISIVFFALIGHDLAGNYVFSALFGVVALLFAADLFRRRMDFRPPSSGWERRVCVLLAAMIFSYPAISLALGHVFPRTIVPGTFPCPTTALALLMLTFALPRVDKIVYGLLLFWAVALPPFVQIPKYGVYEDGIMLGAGIYAAVMLILRWSDHTAAHHKAMPTG